MEKRSIISGLLIAVLLLLVIGCNTGGGGSPAVTYAIGDTGPAGGLIFYIDEADVFSWTYLEVAPASTEGTLNVWGGYGTTVTGADGTAIGTGAQNTIDIVTQFGGHEPYESKTDYAAKICSDLESGGYADWFLPSKDELDAIWDNLVDDGTGSNNGVGGFASGYYWSSSEYNGGNAWFQGFTIGNQDYDPKYGTKRVRAVRAF